MRLLLAAVATVVVACTDGQATANARGATSGVVDSIVDPQLAIARFVASSPEPENLVGGAANPDELVVKLFDALSRHDTASVGRMAVSRAEYGYFYYPTSVYSKKPYELPPDVAWMLSAEASAKGARRMLGRLGGKSVKLGSHECMRVEREESNEIHSDCGVSYADGENGVETRRLFRAIIVRDGVAKFLSYSGDF